MVWIFAEIHTFFCDGGKKVRKKFGAIAAKLLIAMTIIATTWKTGELWREHAGQPAVSDAGAVVRFLDVGQGMATLIESDGHFMLVDGGDRENAETVLDCLEEAGVEKLDYLVISHYDADHLYGTIRVIEQYEIDMILCPDYEADSNTYRWFAEEVETAGAEGDEGGRGVFHPDVGDCYELGSCGFTVVSPVRMDYHEENNLSLGIRLVCGNVSFLLMGDAEIESEYDVCEGNVPLQSTVYMVNHHGSNSSSSQQLLKTVRPEYGVISCGRDNDYGHPTENVLNRLAEYGVTVFRTDLLGTITAITDGEEIEWTWETSAASDPAE